MSFVFSLNIDNQLYIINLLIRILMYTLYVCSIQYTYYPFSISSKIMLTINIIRISKFINQSEWRCVNYPIRDCIIDMIDIDRQFIRRFWSHKIAFIIKGPRNIFFFFIYLRKLSRLRGKFFSTALVKDSVYVKYCSVLSNAVLEN